MFINNKYTEWYFAIVNKAREIPRIKGQGVYYEKHHIIPKSLEGSNEEDNLVLLTAREHFVCHLLLTRMVEGELKKKMCYALSKMTFQSNSTQKRKLKSSEYELARKIVAKNHGENMKGRKPWNKGLTRKTDERVNLYVEKSLETKNTREYIVSEETRKKIGIASSSRERSLLTKEHREKISKSKKGVKRNSPTKETKLKQSGVEYHDPITLKTKRFKTHLDEKVPEGWIKGRPSNKNFIWITNGTINKRIRVSEEIPEEYKKGRTMKKDIDGRFV